MKKQVKAARLGLIALTVFVTALCMRPETAAAASAETTAYQFLTDEMELSPAAACGVMSNIYYESGFRSDIYGPGGSYGICQWLGVRNSRLRSWCSGHGYSSASLNGQLHFLQYELKNYYPSVYRYLQSVSNTAAGAYNAGYYWCYHFEIPANTYSTAVFRGGKARSTYWPAYGASSTYVTASVAGSGIKLSWNATSKYGYVVKRADKKSGSYQTIAKITRGSEKTYTDKTVTNGSTYYYYVQPLNKAGKAGTRSNQVSCMAKASLQSDQCEIKLSKDSYTYNGKAKKPEVKVYWNSKKLTANKDYTVIYSGNVNAGTATVKVVGKNSYTGTAKADFKIKKAEQSIKASDLSAVYGTVSVAPRASASGRGTLSYQVKDSGIATVSRGRLVIKGVGRTTVKIKAACTKNYAAATKTVDLVVRPGTVQLSTLSSKKGKITLKWRIAKKVSGYQVQYSMSKSFPSGTQTKTVLKSTSSSLQLGDLKSGKYYYVRIRAFRTIEEKNLYGSWSGARRIRVVG